MQYTTQPDPPPLKIGGQRFISHPRPETIGIVPLFGDLNSIYQSDDREATTRDQVGIAPCTDGGPFLYHLPTSLTFKIENELTSITTLQFSNHGAFLAVGTTSGLIRLYCMGRSHEHNVLLQSLQLNYENSLTSPGSDPVINVDQQAMTRFEQNTSWLSLIGKGINIASFGSTSQSSTTTTTTITTGTIPSLSKRNNHNNKNVEYQVHELIGHDTAVTGIQFSSCLNFMLTVDLNGKIIMWALSNEYHQAYMHFKSDQKQKTQFLTHGLTKNQGSIVQRKAQQSSAAIIASEMTSTLTGESSEPQTLHTKLTETNRGTLNDLINKPIILQTWNSVPSTSNNITLSSRGGYFAINHNSIGISIYRTDLPDPIRLLYSIPSTRFNPVMLTPGHLSTWSPNGHYLAVPWEQGRIAIYAPLYPEIPDPTLNNTNNNNNNNNNNNEPQQNRSILNINYPHRLLSPTPGRITALTFSPCGRYLFTADTTLTMVLWDINSEQPVWVLDPLLLMYNTRELINSSNIPFEPNQYENILNEKDDVPNPINFDPTQITHPQLFTPYGHLSPGDTLFHGHITQQSLPPYHEANQLDCRFTSAAQPGTIKNPALNDRNNNNNNNNNNMSQPDHNTNPLYLPPPPPIKINGSWPLTPNGTIHTDIITSCSFTYNTLASNRIFNQSTYPTEPIPLLEGLPPHLPRSNMKINSAHAVQVAPPDIGLVEYQLPFGPKPQYFPFILSTTSLDGTTKLWNITPNYPTTVSTTTIERSSGVFGPNLANLNVNLLQTIYTKNHLVQKATFTSRNLLLIAVTEDENVDGIKTISKVQSGGKIGEVM